MKIRIRKSAIKDLHSINIREREIIHAKIIELEKFPNIQNIKKLTQFEPAFRLRVGDYRILFDVIEDIIVIGRVLHRSVSYKK